MLASSVLHGSSGSYRLNFDSKVDESVRADRECKKTMH